MTAIERLIMTARNEIGYLEKATNSQLDSKTANVGFNDWNKYARDLDKTNLYNGPKNGYWWCFTEGTLVLTSNGYKPIEDIKIGDLVMNAYGNKFNQVIDTNAHKANVIDMAVYGTIPITVTTDHPFLSKRCKFKYNSKKGYKDYGFNEIGKLNKKDIIAFPKTSEILEFSLTDNEVWTLGYYVGNGFASNNSNYILCGSDKNLNQITKHIDIIPENTKYVSKNCTQVSIDFSNHPYLKDELDDCGNNMHNKRIPKKILFGDIHKKKIFLNGYLYAVGFSIIEKSEFTTVSKELATGLSRLIMDLGYECLISNKAHKFDHKEIIYVCKINKNKRISLVEDNMAFVPIKKMNKNIHEDVVYMISVDGDHTYTANNLSVHNCDIFVDWCFVKTFGFDMAKKLECQPLKGAGAGCTYSAGYYKENNRFFKSNPQPGDQIFFTNNGGKTFYHTGLVEKVANGRVYTIEGNTTSGPGVERNGGAVAAKSYPLNASYIGGYGRPDYSLVDKNYIYPNTQEDDDDMDDAKFKQMYLAMRKTLQDNDSSAYSKEARDWAINNGLVVGGKKSSDGEPNYMWEDLLTREQLVTVLYRFGKEYGLF